MNRMWGILTSFVSCLIGQHLSRDTSSTFNLSHIFGIALQSDKKGNLREDAE